MNATFATWLLQIISSPATRMFATTMVQIMLNVRSSLSVSISGPGLRPWIRSAPIRMAVPRLPGMPNATMGSRAPPRVALFAASGAMTPRMSPRPNFEASLADWTACP